jgi:hypothetical protein
LSANTNEGAADQLRDLLLGAIRPLAGAVVSVRQAQSAMGMAQHISDAILSAATLILAVEALEEAAKEAAHAARSALRDRMLDAGCWNLGGDVLTVTLADGPRTVTITDRDALAKARPDLFGKPTPDRGAIGAELRRGRIVEGATLSNGGESVLKIIPRKKVMS